MEKELWDLERALRPTLKKLGELSGRPRYRLESRGAPDPASSLSFQAKPPGPTVLPPGMGPQATEGLGGFSGADVAEFGGTAAMMAAPSVLSGGGAAAAGAAGAAEAGAGAAATAGGMFGLTVGATIAAAVAAAALLAGGVAFMADRWDPDHKLIKAIEVALASVDDAQDDVAGTAGGPALMGASAALRQVATAGQALDRAINSPLPPRARTAEQAARVRDHVGRRLKEVDRAVKELELSAQDLAVSAQQVGGLEERDKWWHIPGVKQVAQFIETPDIQEAETDINRALRAVGWSLQRAARLQAVLSDRIHRGMAQIQAKAREQAIAQRQPRVDAPPAGTAEAEYAEVF